LGSPSSFGKQQIFAVWLERILAPGCASLFLSSRITCETTTVLCFPVRCGFLSFYSCVIFHKHIGLRLVCSAISYIAAECITSVITRYSHPEQDAGVAWLSCCPSTTTTQVVVPHRWSVFCSSPRRRCMTCDDGWQIFHIIAVTDVPSLITKSLSHALLHNHFITHRSCILLPFQLMLQLFIFM
jgi:hypothetical protein